MQMPSDADLVIAIEKEIRSRKISRTDDEVITRVCIDKLTGRHEDGIGYYSNHLRNLKDDEI